MSGRLWASCSPRGLADAGLGGLQTRCFGGLSLAGVPFVGHNLWLLREKLRVCDSPPGGGQLCQGWVYGETVSASPARFQVALVSFVNVR